MLSDIAMPGTDGYSFIEKLRALPRLRVPVDRADGVCQRAGPCVALAVGFETHLTKSVDPAVLVRAIANSRLEKLALSV
ncbi:MAG: hypothetical protein ABI992_02065 [Chthoniobacterales bacterium]